MEENELKKKHSPSVLSSLTPMKRDAKAAHPGQDVPLQCALSPRRLVGKQTKRHQMKARTPRTPLEVTLVLAFSGQEEPRNKQARRTPAACPCSREAGDASSP